MMILSVDHGTDRSGFVTFDGRRVHRAGVVFNDVMLAMVREPGIADVLAIEKIEAMGDGVGMTRRDMTPLLLWLHAKPEGAHISECAEQMGVTYKRASELMRRTRPMVVVIGHKKAVRWCTPGNVATALAWYAAQRTETSREAKARRRAARRRLAAQRGAARTAAAGFDLYPNRRSIPAAGAQPLHCTAPNSVFSWGGE